MPTRAFRNVNSPGTLAQAEGSISPNAEVDAPRNGLEDDRPFSHAWGHLEVIARDLEDLYGFSTEVVTNPTKKQMRDKLAEYARHVANRGGGCGDCRIHRGLAGHPRHGEYDERAPRRADRLEERRQRRRQRAVAHKRLEIEFGPHHAAPGCLPVRAESLPRR